MLFGIHVNFIHYSHYKIKLSTYVVLFIRVLVGVENCMLVKQLWWDELNDVNKNSEPENS